MPTNPIRAVAEGMPSRRQFLSSAIAGSMAVAMPAVALASSSKMQDVIDEHRRRDEATFVADMAFNDAGLALEASIESFPIPLPPGARLGRIDLDGADAEIERLRRSYYGLKPAGEAMIHEAAVAYRERIAAFEYDRLLAESIAISKQERKALRDLIACRPATLAEAAERASYLLDEFDPRNLDKEDFIELLRSSVG